MDENPYETPTCYDQIDDGQKRPIIDRVVLAFTVVLCAFSALIAVLRSWS